jgi:glycosyltransferase involved in cell wall biosynthesis
MYSIDLVIPVYKPGLFFQKTLRALACQKITSDIIFNIIVVEDGSHDQYLPDLVKEFNNVQLLSLAENGGRAQARNAGANYGNAEFILFIDADCEAIENDLIIRHIKILTSGFDVSFGSTKPQIQNAGFWTGYLSVIEKKRNAAAMKNNFMVLTSQHFAIRRTVFKQAGGFDPGYRYYGFEDRDLIATLIQNNARMHYSSELTVLHDVDLKLSEICQKMTEAGQYTAGLFAKKHPSHYAGMAFSVFDFRQHPVALTIPWLLSVPIVATLPQLFDNLISKSLLPYPLAHATVKFLSALAFLQGTARSTKRRPNGPPNMDESVY